MICRILFRRIMLRLYLNNAVKGFVMKVVIASNNKGKVSEFKEMLEPLGYEAISLEESGIDVDIIEDGETFSENARIKAEAIYNITKLPTIADDSGLEIDFLDGAPGVYSARYAGEGASDIDRCNKVLDEMSGVGRPLRNARFVSSIYFIKDDDTEYNVIGTCEGYIGDEIIDGNGFGYDYIFMVDKDVSMSMLSGEEKNRISHRGKALVKLVEAIKGDT